jgi:hypothetical protein
MLDTVPFDGISAISNANAFSHNLSVYVTPSGSIAGAANIYVTDSTLGIGTSTVSQISNALVIFGSENIHGNIIITNSGTSTSGVYFPDGTFQNSAAFYTPPAGSQYQVQINSGSGTFAASSALTFNTATNVLAISGNITTTGTSGNIYGVNTIYANAIVAIGNISSVSNLTTLNMFATNSVVISSNSTRTNALAVFDTVTGNITLNGNLALNSSITSNVTTTANFINNAGVPVGYTYVLDDIGSAFNGIRTSFNITINDGTPFTPTNPTQLQIEIGGRSLFPAQYVYDYHNLPETATFNRGFIIGNTTNSTNTITFASAPSSGMEFYGTVRNNGDAQPAFKYKQVPFSALNIMLGP